MEQGAGRMTGNSTECREHGTGYGKDDREQYSMQVTWNRVQKAGQGTVQNAGDMEQSLARRSGNSTGCREHGTEYIKVAREQYRMQGTWNRVREG